MNYLKNLIEENPYVIHVLIFFFGIFGFLSGFIGLFLYACAHFGILLLLWLSPTFAAKRLVFLKDQETIKNHYLEDFKWLYYTV